MELDRGHPYADAHDGAGTWLVHDGEFPKVDAGMVSDGHGFEDSPDCERICGGINSKGPTAMAIGRQANMLSWGFYGAPDRMTDSSKRAFLNAIVYMKRFDGQAPLVQKKSIGRTWLRQSIDALENMSLEQRNDEKNARYVELLKGRFPGYLTADGIDIQKLRDWYAANEEYLVCGNDRDVHVDPRLAELELGNRKPELLDWILARLAADPADPRALALGDRYLDLVENRSADAIVAFITENRPYLFFTDTGGYRWMVHVNEKRAATPTATAR